MTEYWCVVVFRGQGSFPPASILGPYTEEEDAFQAKLRLPEGFHGLTWRMATEVRP